MKKSIRSASALLAAGIALALGSANAAELKVRPDGIEIKPQTQAAAYDLRISRPDGEVIQHTALDHEGLFVSRKLLGKGFPDGVYTYEIVPVMGVAVRDGDADFAAKAEPQGLIESGNFAVFDGRFHFDAALTEARASAAEKNDSDNSTRDQVIADDLIVQGSICAGFDCVNNESFGFDTIRLKENNTRIKFEDTSTGAFPSTDWQLTANDSASGGQNKFSIEDITSARVPFTIEGGSTTNSLYVDSTGRIGFRTSTPVLDLHIATSNTPGIRLEQNNSGGFTAQTWDIAGNETNFFVRDVTGGSRLSFRIRPGAPTSSIDVAADGDVGIGTASPGSSLHVRRTSDAANTAQVKVEDASASTVDRPMFVMTNNGGSEMFFENTNTGNTWKFKSAGGDESFLMNFTGTAGQELVLSKTGNLTISGTLTELSDQNAKTGIVPLDPAAVLAAVAALPLAEWRYSSEPQSRHIGPMAQDFHRMFGLGSDETRISPRDMAGVALASSQALLQMIKERDEQIAELREMVADLVRKVEAEPGN